MAKTIPKFRDALEVLCRHQVEAESVEQRLGRYTVRVLGLEALIRVKELTARDKDRAVLAILRRTLAERKK